MYKIGIMTWFRYRNFGTALQAVALNRVIRSMGYEAYDISYNPEVGRRTHDSERRRPLFPRIINRVTGLVPLVDEGRELRYEKFLSRYLPTTAAVESDSDFRELERVIDAFVSGSDQVWSPRFFDGRYYLDFVHDARKKIAYAASFGCDSLNGYEHATEISKLIRDFNYLSVREISAAGIVGSCTGVRPQIVLDPTLLLSASEWKALAVFPEYFVKRPYCILYFLGNNPDNMHVAQRIAEKKGLAPVLIPVFQRDLKLPDAPVCPIGPAEFLALISGASYVCTDSFHGVAFATEFSKPFSVFEKFDPKSQDSQNTRIYSFIKSFSFSDRLIRRDDLDQWWKCASISDNLPDVSDYLCTQREESLRFLSSALNGAVSDRFVQEEVKADHGRLS